MLSCIRHQEGWCCQTVTGAGCEAAVAFLAHLKDGFDYTSWGRCWEVSCFSWPMRDFFFFYLFARRLVWLEYPFRSGIPRLNIGWKGVTWKGDRKKILEVTRGWICPCKIALPFHLPEHAPQTQLVDVKQLTRLWYKLINDTQLARRGENTAGRKRKVNTLITSIKRKTENRVMLWNIQQSQLLCCK